MHVSSAEQVMQIGFSFPHRNFNEQVRVPGNAAMLNDFFSLFYVFNNYTFEENVSVEYCWKSEESYSQDLFFKYTAVFHL